MGRKAWLRPVSSHPPWDGPSSGPSQQLGPDSQALVPWGTGAPRAGMSLSLTQLLPLLPTPVTPTHSPASPTPPPSKKSAVWTVRSFCPSFRDRFRHKACLGPTQSFLRVCGWGEGERGLVGRRGGAVCLVRDSCKVRCVFGIKCVCCHPEGTLEQMLSCRERTDTGGGGLQRGHGEGR